MIQFFLKLLIWLLRALFKSSGSLVFENLALRQQLATYARGQKRPHVKPQERIFWVALSKAWSSWRSALIMVKPETVIAWHRRGFTPWDKVPRFLIHDNDGIFGQYRDRKQRGERGRRYRCHLDL